MIKREKRVTALSLSIMLMLNMTATAVPVSAEVESKVYTHDGYTVEYTVKNEWTGNQNIEVTITNTGDDILSGWAMGYNAFGEIGGLWNAKIYGHQGTEYILSSAGYNDELAPGQSTNFGYTLTGDKFKIPQNIVNCAERVDITEGYNVYYNITADFVDTYQAEMIIENTSDTDISAWQLSFDGNVSIDNLWNGKLLENNNGSFKVKNAENNSVIAVGSSVSFNFGGAKNTETEPDPGYSEPAETTPPVTAVTDGFFETEIAAESAETDAANPEADPTETETPTESDVVPVSEVVFSNYKLTGVVIPMEFDFEIDPEIDSDEDGLPDYMEKEIGSDRYNPDTDGDGLPDGYEYFTLGTDPKKADSDDNGIFDADEDFDEDGLTNLEEYNLGTDPFSKDTDYDGLSDYDEVKIHSTDPLKYDTDGDKVSDGDEIELGLDPKNPATNGYPDNEYTTEQTVGEDSEALDYINNIEDNPYTVSVEITAAGVAENNLSAGESGYSYSILQNDAVLGVVPELSYSDGLSVTDVVINFNIDASQTDTSIENLMVFKYFEDTNMLLPNKHGKGYVGKGFEKYMNENNSNPHHVLNSTCILPINSDPTSIDSDDDGFLDNAYVNNYENVDEKDKITYEWVKQSDKYFNVSDPNPLKKEIIWQWPAYYSDGTYINRLQSSFREGREGYEHNGIDITPKAGKKDNCKAIASYAGTIQLMKENSATAGNYIEIKHVINGKIYISRYLHLKEFNQSIYEQYTLGKTVNVNAGDIIGIIGDTASPGAVHLHYTLCKEKVDTKIDPLCFDIDVSGELITNPDLMFMKLPIGLRKTCDNRCDSCNKYFKKLETRYKLDETDWGDLN